MQINILNEIYDAYKEKVKEASSMWKSEYCYSQKEEDDRDKEDIEDLRYFKELLLNLNETMDYLLDILEEEHLGMRGFCRSEIEKRWGIEV